MACQLSGFLCGTEKILAGRESGAVSINLDVLKRNTDSLRCAVENDVFDSLPQDSLLNELEMGD